jgi:DNA-binding response OmpR family regulator
MKIPVKGRILLIEDDRDISVGVRIVLTRSQFEVAHASDGKHGLRSFHSFHPDLVILDIGLPDIDGWTVLERIRDMSDVPVLILTAHGQETEKVRGLLGGADDYLTKPFGNRELAARTEALLRRPRAAESLADTYDDGVVQVKFGASEVRVNGVPVNLTPTEYRLMSALVRHTGQTLAPRQLLELAWKDPYGVGPDRVKFTVMRLRHKLDRHHGPGSLIQAVRGFGYRYVPPALAGRTVNPT